MPGREEVDRELKITRRTLVHIANPVNRNSVISRVKSPDRNTAVEMDPSLIERRS